jgi:peptidyl-dipeptidase A
VESPLLRRRVEVLYRTFEERQGDGEMLGRIEELEAEANAIYGNHRSVVGGEKLGENEIRDLLRLSEDLDVRREAWEASKSVGRAVEGTVRELARLRNRLSREQGYENYYARSLELQEIEARELAGIMDELASATDAPFGELKNDIDAGLSLVRFSTGRLTWQASTSTATSRGRTSRSLPAGPSTASGSTCGV